MKPKARNSQDNCYSHQQNCSPTPENDKNTLNGSSLSFVPKEKLNIKWQLTVVMGIEGHFQVRAIFKV